MMNKTNLILGILIEESCTYSLTEVCHKYHISEQLLNDMIEEGLFSTQKNEQHQVTLDQQALKRIESAMRLHRDLGINLPGVALTLDLLEQMKALQKELNILRKML